MGFCLNSYANFEYFFRKGTYFLKILQIICQFLILDVTLYAFNIRLMAEYYV